MPLHSELSTTTDLGPLDNERCARKLISLRISLSDRASGPTVGSRRVGLRGFGSGEGVETEQEDKDEILTEESVRMSYMLLGDATGNTTAWCVDKDVSSWAVHLVVSHKKGWRRNSY